MYNMGVGAGTIPWLRAGFRGRMCLMKQTGYLCEFTLVETPGPVPPHHLNLLCAHRGTPEPVIRVRHRVHLVLAPRVAGSGVAPLRGEDRGRGECLEDV